MLFTLQSFRTLETAPKRQRVEPVLYDADARPHKGRISLYFFGYETNPLNQPMG